MSDDTVRSIQDIGLAAYINVFGAAEGITLVKVSGNGSQSDFVFKDPNEKFDEIAVRFPQSESFKFDSAVRVLKSLGYSRRKKNNGRTNGRGS